MRNIYKLPDNAKELSRAISRHSGDITETYKTVDGEKLNVSFYFPENRKENEKLPFVVMIHGGGWSSRRIFEDQNGEWQGDYLGYLGRYLTSEGYAAVSVDYRLCRECAQKENYQLPDLVDDCFDAMKYIADSAEKYDLDLTRASVLGESAGGYLAAAMVTFEKSGSAIDFRTAVIVNGITDLNDKAWGNYVPKSSTHSSLAGIDKSLWADKLSPLAKVNNVHCDVLLLHGAVDSVVNPYHSEEFAERMKKNGGNAEAYFLEGTNHAFLLAEYYKDKTATTAALDLLDAFLDKTLKKGE